MTLELPYQRALRAAQNLLKAGLVRNNSPAFATLAEFDRFMKAQGYRVLQNDEFPFGSDGRQIIYQGVENVLVKIKTKGYAGGPRQGRATMSVEVTDGNGVRWDNALFKIDAQGKILAKNLVMAEEVAELPDGTWGVRRASGKVEPFSKFEVIQGGKGPPIDKQAWADSGHMDFATNFDSSGADKIH